MFTNIEAGNISSTLVDASTVTVFKQLSVTAASATATILADNLNVTHAATIGYATINSLNVSNSTWSFPELKAASGNNSIVVGHTVSNSAAGAACLSGGYGSQASGYYNLSFGEYTEASGTAQTVLGRYNVTSSSLAFIIGNGTGYSERSNALTVDWDGNVTTTAISASTLTVGGSEVQEKLSVGSGISISGATISIDSTVVQEKLSAGDGISITGATISCTLTPGGNNVHIYDYNTLASASAAQLRDYFTEIKGYFDVGDVVILNGASLSIGRFYAVSASSTAINFTPILNTKDPYSNHIFEIDDYRVYELTSAGSFGLISNSTTIYIPRISGSSSTAYIRPPRLGSVNGSLGSDSDKFLNGYFAGNITANNIPAPPSGDGNYTLTCSVSSGSITYSWVTA